MKTRIGLWGAVTLGWLGASTPGCDDPAWVVPIEDASDALGNGYCHPMFTCDCEVRAFETEQACRAEVDMNLEATRMLGEERGLTYDPTCLGDYLEAVDARGCGPSPRPSQECRRPCNLYVGTSDVGQPCQHVGGRVSECDQGLECDGETCYDPCQRAAAGESCERMACDDGLFCDWDDPNNPTTRLCRALPDAGEPCPFGDCRSGSFCEVDPADPTITACVALLDDGERCMGHRQCRSSHCPVGKCEPMPGEGAPCPASVCAWGLECIDGTCTPGRPALCHESPPL